MPKSKMPASVQKLSDSDYNQWQAVYEKNKHKGKERAAKMAWGAVKKESLSLEDMFLINEQIPETEGRQDPRTVSIKKQLISLIQSTDLDDNVALDSLKAAIEQILGQF